MACICGHPEEDHSDGIGICYGTLYGIVDGDEEACACEGYEEDED